MSATCVKEHENHASIKDGVNVIDDIAFICNYVCSHTSYRCSIIGTAENSNDSNSNDIKNSCENDDCSNINLNNNDSYSTSTTANPTTNANSTVIALL